MNSKNESNTILLDPQVNGGSKQKSSTAVWLRSTILLAMVAIGNVANGFAATGTWLEHQTTPSHPGAGGVREMSVRAGTIPTIRFDLRNRANNRRIPGQVVTFFQEVQGAGLIELGVAKTNNSGRCYYNFRTHPIPGRAYIVVVRYYGGSGLGASTNRIRIVTR
jgi:hypothetical protein